MKCTEADVRNGEWFFCPSSRAVTGLWVVTSPIIRVSNDEGNARKGEALMEALNSSRHDVPLPDPKDNLVAPILEMSGVKSWSTFARRANFIRIELDEVDGIRLKPFEKLGSKGAFQGMSDKVKLMPTEATFERGRGARGGPFYLRMNFSRPPLPLPDPRRPARHDPVHGPGHEPETVSGPAGRRRLTRGHDSRMSRQIAQTASRSTPSIK